MTKITNIEDVAISLGAEIVNPRNSLSTYSDYRTLKFRGRSIELRGSDHGNWPNPTTPKTVADACTLRYTARGYERALALWLGYTPTQLSGLKLSTMRDCKALAAMTPAA